MKKKIICLLMIIIMFTFTLSINVKASTIGRIGSGAKVTFTESDTDTEEVSSTVNIEEYIEEKKTAFINALAEADVNVDLNKSNINPNTLFSTSESYKYAVINDINRSYQMLNGTLTTVYTVTYTSFTVTRNIEVGDQNILRRTTTYYHTIVEGTLTITGDDNYSKNYLSGDEENENDYIAGNITDEAVINKINEYREDMNNVAADYRTTATVDGEISRYYYNAHDEITQDMETGQIVINTILDKYQIYTLTGTAETKKITYTLDSEKGNQIIFKDYEGIVFVFNSTDILNLTEDEIQAIADDLEMDIEDVMTMGNDMIEAAQNAVKGKGNLVGLYDFSISNGNGFKEQADGGFKIRIKMTDEMKKYNSFSIAFLKDDGTIDELIELTANGDYLEGVVPHLSTYVVIGNNVEINNPQTSDNILLYVSMLCLSLIGFVVIYFNKKRFN